MECIYSACGKFLPIPAGPGHGTWSGTDVKDLLLLYVYTRLRISDVAGFATHQHLKVNDVFLRIHGMQGAS